VLGATEPTILDILNYADQISTIALLIFAFVGLHRRWWVPGWAYAQAISRFQKMEAEKNAWRDTALKAQHIATDAFDEYKRVS